jgi:hypothetical protein
MHKLALLQADRHDLLSEEDEAPLRTPLIGKAEVTIMQIPRVEPLQMDQLVAHWCGEIGR